MNISDPSVMPRLRRLLRQIEGVTIECVSSRKMTGMEESEEDIRLGRVYEAKDVDDMFKQILG